MKNNGQKIITNLHNFLSDTEGLSKKEVADELRTAGVDVERFNFDVRSIVATAQENCSTTAKGLPTSDLRTKSRSEILRLLEQIKAGVFGNEAAELLAAREQDGKELAEQDMRDLLQATRDRREQKQD